MSLIEAVMYFALGVLVAGILALAIAPAIWRRAARLTRARVEATLPMTLAEIQADKDQLRAGFAVSTRRLETTLGKLEEQTIAQTIDIGRKRAEIERLSTESAGRAATIREFEERVAALDAEKAGMDGRLAALAADIAARDQDLASRGERIAGLERDLEGAIQTTEEQKLELVARNTEIGNFRDEVAAARIAYSALSVARDDVAAALAAEQAGLAAEKRRGEGLEGRIAARELERTDRMVLIERRASEIREHEAELTRERNAREGLASEAAALEARRREHAEAAERHAMDVERLKAELAAAGERQRDLEGRLVATEIRAEEARTEASGLAVKAAAADADGDIAGTRAALEAERTDLATRLARAEEQSDQLRTENAELRRIAGPGWEIERLENGRLREKLAHVAAEIVRMAQAAQAAGSAPATAPEPPAPQVHVNGGSPHAAEQDNGAAPQAPRPAIRAVESDEPPSAAPAPARPIEGKTLAERIRALQHAGSRH